MLRSTSKAPPLKCVKDGAPQVLNHSKPGPPAPDSKTISGKVKPSAPSKDREGAATRKIKTTSKALPPARHPSTLRLRPKAEEVPRASPSQVRLRFLTPRRYGPSVELLLCQYGTCQQ